MNAEEPSGSSDEQASSGIDARKLRAIFDLARAEESVPEEAEVILLPTIDELGKLLPDFRIEKPLKRGGMGAVYSAWQKNPLRRVAIKLLAPRYSGIPHFVQRFREEADVLASLRDPGIVSVYSCGQIGGWCYIVMEMIEGLDLEDVVASGGLPLSTALDCVQNVARALEHAHEKQVIHRDIKPSNIIESKITKKPVVVDFGLARVMGGPVSALTRAEVVAGSAPFTAPEQWEMGETGPWTDVYSLGATLCCLVSGLPLPDPRAGRMLDPAVIAGLGDPRLQAFLRKATQRDPKDRHQSMAEFVRDLEEIRRPPPLKTNRSDEHRGVQRFSSLYVDLSIAGGVFLLIAIQRSFAEGLIAAVTSVALCWLFRRRKGPTPPTWKQWLGDSFLGYLVVTFAGAIFLAVTEEKGLANGLLAASAAVVLCWRQAPLRYRMVGVAVATGGWYWIQTRPVSPKAATALAPFVNSFGMKFVPVPGKNILMAVRPTERAAFELFAQQNTVISNNEWEIDTGQEPTSPVVAVSWKQANDFAEWLTRVESAKSLNNPSRYRLPDLEEWIAGVAPNGLTSSRLDVRPALKELNKLGVEPLEKWSCEWCRNEETFPNGKLHWLVAGYSLRNGKVGGLRTWAPENDHRLFRPPEPNAKESGFTFRCVLVLKGE